jgi:hypothetical protein
MSEIIITHRDDDDLCPECGEELYVMSGDEVCLVCDGLDERSAS